MTDYEKYIKCLDLYRKAAKLREQGKFEQAWKLEAEAEDMQ